MSDPIALHSMAFEPESKGHAIGHNLAPAGEPTSDQRYLRQRLIEKDDAYGRILIGGLMRLNREFGYGPTTEALRALVEEAREGLVPANPYALLWSITQDRAAR